MYSDPASTGTGVDIVYNYHEVGTWAMLERNVDGNPPVYVTGTLGRIESEGMIGRG